MQAEFKQRWLGALRGDQYQQGTSWLRRADGGFCCLGVLCDLIDPNGWTPGPHVHRWGISENTSILPHQARAVTGLHDQFALDELMRMNDNGQSFAQIADWIEANIPADAA